MDTIVLDKPTPGVAIASDLIDLLRCDCDLDSLFDNDVGAPWDEWAYPLAA